MSSNADQLDSKIEVAAVYKLPASLIFAGLCLGISAPVQIAGLKGELRLPSFKWRSDSHPYIVPPSLDELPSLAGRRLLDKGQRTDEPWFWGSVDSWSPKSREVNQADVGAFLLRFSDVIGQGLTYSEYLYGRGHPIGEPVERLYTEIDAWYETLRIWIRALTDQDADADVEACTASKLICGV